ncbi:MAG: adenine deaminase C-terminal domain-containing protein, partial [Nitrososphaerota archaeon]
YLREGSAWLDIKDTIRAYTEGKVDPRHICLCTDDREPASILRNGHMDHCVRRAIEEGVDPLTAVQMATLNPAERYRVSYEIGNLAPGRFADMLMVSDLSRFKIESVYAFGKLVAREGRLVAELPKLNYPEKFMRSVRLSKVLTPDDFIVPHKLENGEAHVRVIEAIEGSVLTRHINSYLRVRSRNVLSDPDQSIMKTAVIERHGLRGSMSLGFTKGFGFREGAISSTVAHDSHNLLVLGMSERDMSLAAMENARMNGGIVTVVGGEVRARVELPIAGLMSPENAEVVAEKLSKTYEVWEKMGCDWVSPFMTMSLISLSVLPELRLTDQGLLDTVNFKFVDLIIPD